MTERDATMLHGELLLPTRAARFCRMPTSNTLPPLPPFTRETALQKVRLAEDAWNSRDPERVSLAYSPDSRWRNRAEFLTGREAEACA